MGREGLSNGRRHFNTENGNGQLAKKAKPELRPGDVIWIKLRGTSWWPAQVVDSKSVSKSLKPRKRKSGQVLVRLYGTYEYSFVDPVMRRAEFENVLKQHNGSHMEIFQKALKRGLTKSESTRSRKQSGKATGAMAEFADEPNEDVTPEMPLGTARRLKVMLGLGLAAPFGSPFLKKGLNLSQVS